MSSNILIRSVLVVCLGAFLNGAAFQSVEAAPFTEGERFEYKITWFGMNVGTGTLGIEAKEFLQDKEIYRIVSTARSNKVISLFFPVRDKVESIVDAEGIYSYSLRVKQRHGPRRVKKEIYFDQEQHQATLIYKGKTRTYSIPPQVKDSLSSLYFFRTIDDLITGESVYIDVHESKKNWSLEIQILGREQVTVPMGNFATIKTRARVRYDGALLNKGDVYVWFTDDSRKVPVKIVGRVAIGSFTASLSSATLPTLITSTR